MKVKLLLPGAIVMVAAHIAGTFVGESFEETLRFTRVWAPCDDGGEDGAKWDRFKDVAAHSSVAAAS